MGGPKYRKHCAWCGNPTDEFVWIFKKLRRAKVYCHKEHVGDWDMLKKRQKMDIDRIISKIKEALNAPSPWMDILNENNTAK